MKRELRTNWELEIQRSHLNKGYGRGTFSLVNDRDLVLAYNESDEYGFNEKGRVAIIAGGQLKDIFETALTVWAPTVDDNGDIYIATSGYYDAEVGRSSRSTLYKIRPDGSLVWSFELDGNAQSLPVICQDSVIIFDYTEDTKIGHLNRISKDGKLVWKKTHTARISFEPLILKENARMVLSFRFPNKIFIMDMDGNILQSREESEPPEELVSSQSESAIYACLARRLEALDDRLKLLWAYKPEKRLVAWAPLVTASGNLYLQLSGMRLVSLDPQGKERWTAETGGYVGYQPCLLRSGEILMATSRQSERKVGEEESDTFIEIFDDAGKRTLEYELPGTIFHIAQGVDGTIFAAVNRYRRIRKKGRRDRIADRAIRVYSFTLP